MLNILIRNSTGTNRNIKFSDWRHLFAYPAVPSKELLQSGIATIVLCNVSNDIVGSSADQTVGGSYLARVMV